MVRLARQRDRRETGELPVAMGMTRRELIESKMLVAARSHPDASVTQRRLERLPKLLDLWTREIGHSECHLCHQRDVELVGGVLDGICIMCVKEIRAESAGFSAIYTSR